MRGIDYRTTSLHYDRGITMSKQYARVNTKEKFQYEGLPCHMQANNGKFASKHHTDNSLKANNYKERPFLDPISSFNTRKDFRINSNSKKVVTAIKPGSQSMKTKKKNLTFN
jgi:hypothetical protein